MTALQAVLLLATVSASVLRNAEVKKLGRVSFGTKAFFRLQTVLFFSGSVALAVYTGITRPTCSVLTVGLSLLYALFLLAAQWMYTAALSHGEVSVCALVYSMGFLIPTLFGCLYYREPMTVGKGIGIALAVGVVIASNINKKQSKAPLTAKTVVPLVLAMLSSGMLGVLQKIQQNTAVPQERPWFVWIAFSVAAAVSWIAGHRTKSDTGVGTVRWSVGVTAGVAFALANMLNTYLSGVLDAAVFFPISNIGVILVTMLCGILLFGEKPTLKKAVLFLGSAAAIFLITL